MDMNVHQFKHLTVNGLKLDTRTILARNREQVCTISCTNIEGIETNYFTNKCKQFLKV